MEKLSVGLRRSEIDGYFATNTNRTDRKCRESNGRINLRSESNGMEMFSVGLRRSEIDGYILRPTLTYAGFFSYALGYQSYAV